MILEFVYKNSVILLVFFKGEYIEMKVKMKRVI